MLNSFIIVGSNVFILFLLIGLGFFGGKVKLINKEGVKCINDIMLYFVTPCVIIDAFQREFDVLLLKNLLLAMAASVLSHLISYALGCFLIKNSDKRKEKVLRFAAIYSNCGFMALPLLNSLLGSEGVFYGAGYLAVFNLLVWSVGQNMMSDNSAFDIKKGLLNPGVISVIIGVFFFFTSIKLPYIIGTPISYMSDLNTPVAMLIIGYTISTLDLKAVFMIREEAMTIFIRLFLSPLILLGTIYFLGIRGVLLSASVVSSSAPVAAISTMFAIKYNADETIASKLVAVSTLLSIISMTLIVGFAQYIA